MRIILHGTKRVGLMVDAAEVALRHYPDMKAGKVVGLRVSGFYFSIKWGKSSVSVWLNDGDE